MARYPSGVAASNVSAVRVFPDGSLMLARATSSSSVEVYRSTTNGTSWTTTTLHPRWSADLAVGGRPSVLVATGDPGVLAIAVEQTFGMTSAVTDLFVSTDGGTTFHALTYPRVSDLNTPWLALTFSTSTDALLITGAQHNHVWCSTDGGATWRTVTLPAVPGATAEEQVGSPLLVGGAVALPVFGPGTDHASMLTLAVSADHGQTFDAEGPAFRLAAPYQPGTRVVGNDGSAVWVVSADARRIYERTLPGGAWSSVPTSGLPDGVTGVEVVTGSAAVAATTRTTCAAGKSDCSTAARFFATTDGGRTWTPTAPS